MSSRQGLWAAILIAGLTAAGCTPVIIGGGAVVAADQIMEEELGGDGLF